MAVPATSATWRRQVSRPPMLSVPHETPNTVTFAGSPPNPAALRRTQRRARLPILQAVRARSLGSRIPEVAEHPEPAVDRDDRHPFLMSSTPSGTGWLQRIHRSRTTQDKRPLRMTFFTGLQAQTVLTDPAPMVMRAPREPGRPRLLSSTAKQVLTFVRMGHDDGARNVPPPVLLGA
jgi:hypothetical protein